MQKNQKLADKIPIKKYTIYHHMFFFIIKFITF